MILPVFNKYEIFKACSTINLHLNFIIFLSFFIYDLSILAQVISNGKLKSVYHRVVASYVGPRISTACFLSGNGSDPTRLCGPLKELISEENPPLYRDFLLAEYTGKFMSKALDDSSCLDFFKL